ncbi:helix-turn-helix domain-containing protein [bacterium]|nr:helix-turn-helix domain-containing protein [bacterium]
MNEKVSRKAPVFPKNSGYLEQLGENIQLARKRRRYTQQLLSDRTGYSRMTIRKIEKGDPAVSIGHYLGVLSVLGLAEDLTIVASDDDLGRKLRDIELLRGNKS